MQTQQANAFINSNNGINSSLAAAVTAAENSTNTFYNNNGCGFLQNADDYEIMSRQMQISTLIHCSKSFR